MPRPLAPLLCLIILPVASCGEASSSGLPRVVCTIGMIGDLVGQIGGNTVEIQTLMGPGVDPHLYKPTQGDIRKLENADLVFYNGLHLEGKMGQVFESVSHQRPVIAVAEEVPDVFRLQIGDGENAADPHMWMDVSLWVKTISTLVTHLSTLAPQHKEAYETRGQILREDLIELDEWVESRVQSIPAERRVLVTAHDAFGYFGRRYSIEVLSLQGISTLDEASVHDVQRLAKDIMDRNVHAIFLETSIPKRTLEAVKAATTEKGHDLSFGGELFTDAMGPHGTEEGTYIGMIRHNVKTIVEALK